MRALSARTRRLWRAAEQWPYWWIPAMVLSLVAVVLGFIGFREATAPDGDRYSILESMYHTLRLFVLGWPDPNPVPPSLDAARFLAALSTVVIAVRAGLALYAGRIEQVRAHRSRDHTIVCGLGRRGLRTVESLRERGHRVVAIEADPVADGIPAVRGMGALCVVGDATSPAVLRRAGLRRARRLIVTSGGDETSVEIATAAAVALPQVPGGLSAVVQLQDPDLAAALNERMSAQAEGESPLRFTSLLHDAATALVRRHPPPPDGACVVVGLTPFAEALLAAAARYHRMTHEEGAAPLQVAVIDPECGRRMARFRALRPSIAAQLSVEVVEGDPDSGELDAWLERRRASSAPPITQAYVCPGEERRGLSTAIHVARRLPGCPVVVQTMSSGESAGRFLGSGRTPESASRIHVFGVVEETCSMELLLDPRNEVIARALHEEYLRHSAAAQRPGVDATHRPWSELDDDWREANRSHVRDIVAALRSVGIEVLPNDDASVGLLRLTDDEVETLARAEHERWTADRRRRGWTRGTRDDRRRTHPDLVAWEQLPPDSRDIDRALVRARPQLLARAGFALTRVRPMDADRGMAQPAGAV